MKLNQHETPAIDTTEGGTQHVGMETLKRLVRSRTAQGLLTLTLLLAAPIAVAHAESTEVDKGNPTSQVDGNRVNSSSSDSVNGSTNSQIQEQVAQSRSESVEEEKNPRRWRRGDPVAFVGQFYSNINAVYNEGARTYGNTWYNSARGPKSLTDCRFQYFKLVLKPFFREVAVISCDRPGGQVDLFFGKPGQLRKDTWPRRGKQSQLTPENGEVYVVDNLPRRGPSIAEILSKQGIQPNGPTDKDKNKIGGPIANQRPNPNYTTEPI